MRKRPRQLSAEEREIWNRVARTLRPRRPEPRPDPSAGLPDRPDPAIPDLDRDLRGTAAIPGRPKLSEPPVTYDLAPDPAVGLSMQPPSMDARTHTRLKRGKLKPEARIDLHGMTAARAQDTLAGFIARSHSDGLRLVLVITGKGREPDPQAPWTAPRRGVLRHAVPQWLRHPALAPKVLQVVPAHRRHGGEGAYYVYLRRRR